MSRLYFVLVGCLIAVCVGCVIASLCFLFGAYKQSSELGGEIDET